MLAGVMKKNKTGEHASHFFLNDDAEAQQRIIKHLIAPYAKGDFHQEYLHEHAGGRLSVFLEKDLIRIRPSNCASAWRRGAAHLVNALMKKDANKHFSDLASSLIRPACTGPKKKKSSVLHSITGLYSYSELRPSTLGLEHACVCIAKR